MAKLNFKDLIFKFLQRDEDHDCEKVHPKMSHKEWLMSQSPVAHKESYTPTQVARAKEIAKKMSGNQTGATKEIEKIYKGLSDNPEVKKALQLANEDYIVKEDAKEIYYNLDRGIYIMGKDFRKFDREKEKRQGFPNATKLLSTTKAAADYVAKMNEEAPANVTGTAVAGTGDDSSTVVVRKKKKKELQSKLMRRLKIKEAIDKAIPDLEYPKDKIRERANQLKGFAKEYAMGLQVPATSYMKPTGDLNKGKPLRKREMTMDVIPQGELKPLKKKDEDLTTADIERLKKLGLKSKK